MQPGGRAPAPEPLRLVQAFVNTNDIEGGRDQLDRAWGLAGWLSDRGLLPAGEEASESDRRTAVAVREALRSLLRTNAGAKLDPRSPVVLSEAAAEAGLRLTFSPDGRGELASDKGGVPGALAQILAVVYSSMEDGSWVRLKACLNDPCQWAFWDASKNRSGSWCSMAICGSRVKSRAYRARRKEAGRRP
jgi:predicted RNA-binding Zn ribbon-like protein